MKERAKALHVNDIDNVATALVELKKGETILGVTLLNDIPKGHKFAVRDIPKGNPVIKYANHIGLASQDIKKGEWVHVHNIMGERGRGDIHENIADVPQETCTHKAPAKEEAKRSYKLKGYRRGDGSFGFRNHVLVIPSVNCANRVVENIVNIINYQFSLGNEDCRVVHVTHQHGCSELSYDAKQTQDVIAGNGANPNVYGVLVVGLGCEVVQADAVAEQIKQMAPYKKIEHFTIQDAGGNEKSIQKGAEIVKRLITEALQMEKSEGDLSDLILGTECGGSDSFSGLSANPALGNASDIIIQHGGSVILAETTELIGAEQILACRATNSTVKQEILSTVRGFEQRVIDAKADIRGANPSPGNIAGGLSSIEEKSLGCIYKAGNEPVVAVKEYAQKITDKGLTLMNTPGNDIEQLSGMVAGGCNVCVFTTGRGTPTGSAITPTIKVSSNTAIFQKMTDCIDINAGEIIDGTKTIGDVGAEILDFIVSLGEGKFSKAEINKQNDFAIWRLATTV
ncbi:altronate hydrolase [Helicobacter sp. 13S00401-1]|nr:altronate hydrolase [Helicobacter sp. 13S00401-1]